MWLQLLLALTFLLVESSRQVTLADCRPPHLSVGGQCLLVDMDTSGNCTSPFLPVGDQCLYFASFADVSYAEARQMCHSLDSELATVDTAMRHKNIINYIYNNGLVVGKYWIDGSDEAAEGDWRYSSGQPVPMGTPFWTANMIFQEPNNLQDNEHCLQLNGYEHYFMNDGPCSYPCTPLCEQPLNVNSSDIGISLSLQQPRVDCPSFFVSVGGLCLSFMTWADQTWIEARQSCHGLGGELAAVTDIEDLRAIYLYLHQEGIAFHSFWLGGSDAATESVWTWTDDAPVPSGAPFWGCRESTVIEPDGGSSENCLMLNAEGFHYFRDAYCGLLMNPLCQIYV